MKNATTSEMGLCFAVKSYEILIYLTSGKTLGFKIPEVLSCQENNYPSETCPLILAVLVFVILKQYSKQL